MKVELIDGSSKTLMVDERQTVRDVIDNLFEKTHCDCNIDWCVCETNPDLQTGEFNTHAHIHPVSSKGLRRRTMMKCIFIGVMTAQN